MNGWKDVTYEILNEGNNVGFDDLIKLDKLCNLPHEVLIEEIKNYIIYEAKKDGSYDEDYFDIHTHAYVEMFFQSKGINHFYSLSGCNRVRSYILIYVFPYIFKWKIRKAKKILTADLMLLRMEFLLKGKEN